MLALCGLALACRSSGTSLLAQLEDGAAGSGGGPKEASGFGGVGGTPAAEDAGDGSNPCSIERSRFVSVDGHDTGAGTLGDPFATIAHALAQSTPGDTVLVREGVYHELVDVPVSGLPNAPVTLRAYCGERPVIDAAGLASPLGEPAIIRIVDRSHVVIDGFELRNLTGSSTQQFPAGIWVRGAVRDVVLRNNLIHHISAPDGGKNTGAHGIGVYGTSTTPSEDVRIEGNTLHDLVLGWSEALAVNGNVRNFVVSRNVIHHVDNIAFVFIGYEPDVCKSCSQADEIDVDDVNRARNGLIQGNLAYAMSSASNPSYGGEKEAACFYVDGGASLVIERNTAHDCDIGVELASEHFEKSTRGVLLRSNLLYDNDVAGVMTGGYSAGNAAGGGSAKQCWVVNNTIFNSSRNGWAKADLLLQNRNIGNTYANNVIYASDGSNAVSDDGTMNTGNVFDYNLYFKGGLDGVQGGANSITAEPRFVSAATRDLHLAADSPAIGKGRDWGAAIVGSADVDGEPRVQGGIDMGAHER